MPPRLQLLSRSLAIASRPSYQPIAPFLYPTANTTQYRAASILSSLSDTPGAYNKRKRLGRGPSSGKGKTSGRGHKGQKQHGKVPFGMNGGQTPDEVVSGERGFENRFSIDMSPVNLNKIQYWIDRGRLDPAQPITLKELNHTRCIHGVKDGVKLLGRGLEEFKTPINIVVSRASADAIAAVEKAGGTVTTRYYTKTAIKRIMKSQTDPIHSLQSRIRMAPESAEGAEGAAESLTADLKRFPFRLPDPTSRKDLEYYRDSAHRGYLSHLVEEGHGPSLFFKTPGMGRVNRKDAGKKGGKTAMRSENRLW